MKARIQLVEGMTFVAESGSGHAVVVDAAPDVGGRNLVDASSIAAFACQSLVQRRVRLELRCFNSRPPHHGKN